jgi:MFS family permease
MACATRAGALVGRFGVRGVLGGGLTLMAAGMGLFAALITVNGSYAADVLAPGLLVAVGIGFAVVPSTIAATAGARPHEAGLASGLVNSSRQIGGALGLAILVSVAAQYTSHLIDADYQAPLVALTNGFRLSYLLGAAFAAAGALATFRLIPRSPARAPEPAADPRAASHPPPGPQPRHRAVSSTGVNPNGNREVPPGRRRPSAGSPGMRGGPAAARSPVGDRACLGIPVVLRTASGASWPLAASASTTGPAGGSERSRRI